jgi:hypothetical protein
VAARSCSESPMISGSSFSAAKVSVGSAPAGNKNAALIFIANRFVIHDISRMNGRFVVILIQLTISHTSTYVSQRQFLRDFEQLLFKEKHHIEASN